MPFGVHPGFLIILLVIVLVVFGPGKLPELGSAVGRGIREFRKESDKVMDEMKPSTSDKESPAPTTPATARTEVPEAELEQKS
ncbi:MAG: twin-arginine translocase TatA/TatE family subunit [Candidatus Nephthysia bennettiae]|uniref:Sec-independent protein translocase protein TatA n=1 Tax=Candidatus Nephthysia bennettiae TaxID=3127016 RepID=A0A934N7M1_9BACT|nr:twin-arginine translocase TatA/TatE family subunit [Candidatus Dormibacteraeota bacterium]PZR94227.1 MAG: twin-arginine translocase TatA/TatE family subunit [Candidatus Dormibacteraeota bacterium]